jgi:hypothetical protein
VAASRTAVRKGFCIIDLHVGFEITYLSKYVIIIAQHYNEWIKALELLHVL